MIQKTFSLDFQWPVQEPFLFCVHHEDYYPVGNPNFGPKPKDLEGRDIGQDFKEKDGFRMYHGDEVPGFPVHPHRGFETITIVRRGFVDHADSLGAAGRYGNGDVQWMTAGEGVQHSEMFPMLKQDAENTLELFQIWLNLPKRNKMVPPHFTMFWSEKIPKIRLDNSKVDVTLVAGQFEGQKALPPPPDSWAADAANELLILLVKMESNSKFNLKSSSTITNRTIYVFEGGGLKLGSESLSVKTGFVIDSAREAEFTAGTGPVQFLVLQAKPIDEPVVQYGPFVMNTKAEIQQAFQDYQSTQFGGWSWPRQDMVHGDKLERFAKYPDGRIEKPSGIGNV